MNRADTFTGSLTKSALAGASYCFQIGGKETDGILIAVNDKGLQDLLKSKVKLGAEASVAAGPVGRMASANTNVTLSAELLSYSRSKGVSAGLDLNGADVAQNIDDRNTFYGGNNKSFSDILHGGGSGAFRGAQRRGDGYAVLPQLQGSSRGEERDSLD